jgi:acyl carrier protein
MSDAQHPATSPAEQIRRIVLETVSLPAAARELPDPLAGREIDSVGIIQLLAALEDHFGVGIPPEEIRPENFGSVASLAAMIVRLIKG